MEAVEEIMALRLVIYMLVNKLDGKIYIGKSKRYLSTRIADHKYHAKIGKKMPISRAIAKYGWNNFDLIILEQCDCEEILKKREMFWINKKDSTNKNIGYNIFKEINGLLVIDSQEVKDKIRKASQGKKGQKSIYSKFLGARWWMNKQWYCQISINGQSVSKLCKNEKEAAICYDKVALFHYGNDAVLNFPQNKKKYLKLNLQKFFNWFIEKPKTSKYEGVCFDKARKQWVANKIINGKRVLFKRFDIEKEAYDCYCQFIKQIK